MKTIPGQLAAAEASTDNLTVDPVDEDGNPIELDTGTEGGRPWVAELVRLRRLRDTNNELLTKISATLLEVLGGDAGSAGAHDTLLLARSAAGAIRVLLKERVLHRRSCAEIVVTLQDALSRLDGQLAASPGAPQEHPRSSALDALDAARVAAKVIGSLHERVAAQASRDTCPHVDGCCAVLP